MQSPHLHHPQNLPLPPPSLGCFCLPSTGSWPHVWKNYLQAARLLEMLRDEAKHRKPDPDVQVAVPRLVSAACTRLLANLWVMLAAPREQQLLLELAVWRKPSWFVVVHCANSASDPQPPLLWCRRVCLA